MAKDLQQIEKNVSTSFSYVKKDLLMVNDSVSELVDKIQHLSMNQAMLLEKVAELEKMVNTKKAAKKTPVKKVAKEKKAAKKTPVKKVAKEKKAAKKTSKTPKKVVTETVLYE
jgi:hypothetical protein